ncbi:MAG TPA: calcium/proton exchanger [Candidatus Limnocylindria bacterium]|nr:calcium/proton exchanger [Candidatus Limnocylindria bacterium]
MPAIKRRDAIVYGGYAAAFVVLAIAKSSGLSPMVIFVLGIVALALGAMAVGEATTKLSHRLSPAATGVVQSVLGNLPELFLAIFALQAGLYSVVAAAIIGSVLGNLLFVLGLALVVGGFRHGRLQFSSGNNNLYATVLLLGVAALIVPFLATQVGAPDFGHANELSAVVAITLLVIFAISIPIFLRLPQAGPGTRPDVDEEGKPEHPPSPLLPTVVTLAVSAGSAAFVADWFVEALQPAMASIGMSEAFAGLIVIALAGNAVENLVAISAAWHNRADLSLALVLNSALQIVLFLAPVLVLLSFLVAPAPLTLVFTPLLLGVLAVSVILVFAIVLDGEANALEGAMLLGLYVIIAAAVYWGPQIHG